MRNASKRQIESYWFHRFVEKTNNVNKPIIYQNNLVYLYPERIIYLCLKDERKIPLTPVQQPNSISDLEDQAADLAKFLDLKLENL